MPATTEASPQARITSLLADYRQDMGRLAEVVVPGVGADIRRVTETLVTDLEGLIPGLNL